MSLVLIPLNRSLNLDLAPGEILSCGLARIQKRPQLDRSKTRPERE